MLAAFEAFLLAINMMSGARDDNEHSGLMPEIVATAPRYEGEDNAYSGMMPEIVVTAPRPAEEEMDMMPEVVVIKSRNNRTIPDMDFSRVFHTCRLLLYEESDETVFTLAKEQ